MYTREPLAANNCIAKDTETSPQKKGRKRRRIPKTYWGKEVGDEHVKWTPVPAKIQAANPRKARRGISM